MTQIYVFFMSGTKHKMFYLSWPLVAGWGIHSVSASSIAHQKARHFWVPVDWCISLKFSVSAPNLEYVKVENPLDTGRKQAFCSPNTDQLEVEGMWFTVFWLLYTIATTSCKSWRVNASVRQRAFDVQINACSTSLWVWLSDKKLTIILSSTDQARNHSN